jgi:hypothetical protein
MVRITPAVLIAVATAVISSVPQVVAQNYELVKTYQGPNFFDEWSFYGRNDNATNGAVK